MKALLFIFLPFIIFSLDISKYSINSFLDYLQETGYYEIIEEINFLYGSDYAITVCKEFTKSVHCKEAILIYMPAPSRPPTKSGDKTESQSTSTINGLIAFLLKEENLKILSKFYTKEEINTILSRILKGSNTNVMI